MIIQIILIIGLLISLLIYYISKKNKKDFAVENRGKYHQMSGAEFERYLSSLFYCMGYRNIVTIGSHDFGADIILSDGRHKIVIQAKRYKTKVGIKAVQEIFSAQHYYNATQAYVFTSGSYTHSARKLAEKLNVHLCDVNTLMKLEKRYLNKD